MSTCSRVRAQERWHPSRHCSCLSTCSHGCTSLWQLAWLPTCCLKWTSTGSATIQANPSPLRLINTEVGAYTHYVHKYLYHYLRTHMTLCFRNMAHFRGAPPREVTLALLCQAISEFKKDSLNYLVDCHGRRHVIRLQVSCCALNIANHTSISLNIL